MLGSGRKSSVRGSCCDSEKSLGTEQYTLLPLSHFYSFERILKLPLYKSSEAWGVHLELGPSPDLEPARCLPHCRFLYKGTQAASAQDPAQQVLSMTPFGRLCLLRVLGAPPVFLLGLLLALPLGLQGLSRVRFSAARTAHQPPQKHWIHGILKPAAHLVGYPSKQNSLLWRANTDRAFLQYGFSLNNNSLLIPTSGLYFVYSQVVFSGESCSPKATPIYLAHEDIMSTESMIRDVELAEEALPKKAWGTQNSSRCLCLSLFSFLLVAGATTLFCLLNFGVIGPQREEKFPNNLPIISSMAQTLTLRSSSQNSSDKPVAHVVANHQAEDQLEWLSQRANALLANGMDLKDNQLVIPADGLYLVYSQVLFKGPSCSNYVLLTHTVSRFAVSYEDKVNLLSAIKSPCPKETPEGPELKPWYEPIYLGGVFQLEKGDRLSAEVNLPKYLDFAESGQVYFGVIAL
ncbi:hypothetical protein STEG23_013359 [Scotinomys teguina]